MPIEEGEERWDKYLLSCDDAIMMQSFSWNPPGHGNIYVALKESGMMDDLLAKGRDIIFVSNIDNTGAEVFVYTSRLDPAPPCFPQRFA